MSAGYSKTPLFKKLGLKRGMSIRLVGQPENYYTFFEQLPEDLIEKSKTRKSLDFVHYFPKNNKELNTKLPEMRSWIKENGMVWVSWPKKSSGIDSDFDGNDIRSVALSNGLVDVKVCAVSEIWSGLKLMIPVKERKASK